MHKRAGDAVQYSGLPQRGDLPSVPREAAVVEGFREEVTHELGLGEWLDLRAFFRERNRKKGMGYTMCLGKEETGTGFVGGTVGQEIMDRTRV